MAQTLAPVSPTLASREFSFTAEDFARIRSLIYRRVGISLSDRKSEMVYSRLARRLRIVNIASFRDYLDALENGHLPDEWEAFTNALTTNLTAFFREQHHFPILAEHAKAKRTPFSVWCSASSTGRSLIRLRSRWRRPSARCRRAGERGRLRCGYQCPGARPRRHLPDGARVGAVRRPAQEVFPARHRQAGRLCPRAARAAGDDRLPPDQPARPRLAAHAEVRRDLLPQRDDLFRQADPGQDPGALRRRDEAGRPAVRRPFGELPAGDQGVVAARQDGLRNRAGDPREAGAR